MFLDSTPNYDTHAGARVYNEAAFRQFLAADRARAERLRRCLLLILVSIRHESARPAPLEKAVATSMFRGLSTSVREVDFVGWFRERRVAAALLVQGPKPPDACADATIATRVRHAIEVRLPSTLAGALRVRLHRLGGSSMN
jgi:hypothetical protein